MHDFTADALLALFGVLLSLAQWLVPPFKKFQEERLGNWTPLFSVGVFLLITAGVLAWNCQLVLECLKENWQGYWSVFTSAVVTYYGTYQGFVKGQKDKEKAEREAELIRSMALSSDATTPFSER